MISPSFYQKRLQDLADNIAKEQESLKDYEEAAILILRFHDIKTLAPRGVNNS
ncbi:MAG: hypothetical protein ACKO90_10710 [Microcystis panniformis]